MAALTGSEDWVGLCLTAGAMTGDPLKILREQVKIVISKYDEQMMAWQLKPLQVLTFFWSRRP